jgi:LysR family transcriptional regulator, transcription activator of glutamate synthase operon
MIHININVITIPNFLGKIWYTYCNERKLVKVRMRCVVNTDFFIGFMETAKMKSIAKASEALHISHTALSKQLKSLEQQFDVQLFVRSAQGVELTDAGEVLFEHSSKVLDQLASLNSALEPYKGWRHIRVGTLPDIASQYLMPSIKRLEDSGHEVELVLRHSTKDAYKMLFNGDADLLVAERISMHPSMWIDDLHREPLLVVAPKEHPFAALPAVTLSQLSSQPLVLYAEGCTIRAKLTDLFTAVNQPMNIVTEVGFHEVILGYVGSGTGVTVLPEASISNVTSDRFVSIPIDHPDAQRAIAVFSTNRTKGEKLLRLLR